MHITLALKYLNFFPNQYYLCLYHIDSIPPCRLNKLKNVDFFSSLDYFHQTIDGNECSSPSNTSANGNKVICVMTNYDYK